jgi:ArsR family transcriptional regulator, cadmium/lead-responsive transcriptional repressor
MKVRTAPTGGTAAPEMDCAVLAARFFRVLGDPTRVRVLRLLLDAPAGECRVGELVEALDAPQSRVSTHLGCLRWCGLVQARRVGKQVFYRIADTRVRDILALGTALAGNNMAGLSTCGMLR